MIRWIARPWALHRQPIQKRDPNNSSAVHVATNHLGTDWVKARTVKAYWEQRTIEVIKIERSRGPMNLDRGLHLPVWNPLLGQTTCILRLANYHNYLSFICIITALLGPYYACKLISVLYFTLFPFSTNPLH